MVTLYLEDLAPGQRYVGTSRVRVEVNRLKGFAAEFDPQPGGFYHALSADFGLLLMP